MSYGQWTIDKVAGCIADLVTSPKIGGTSALRLWRPAGATQFIVGKTTGVAGLSSGRIRGLIRSTGVGANSRLGLACHIATAVALTSEAYFLTVSGTQVHLTRKVGIPSAGGSFGTLLDQESQTISANTWYAMQLDWQVVVATNGLRLTGYVGTATDFSNLVQKVQADDASPIASPISAGIHASGDIGNFTSYFDTFRIEELEPV